MGFLPGAVLMEWPPDTDRLIPVITHGAFKTRVSRVAPAIREHDQPFVGDMSVGIPDPLRHIVVIASASALAFLGSTTRPVSPSRFAYVTPDPGMSVDTTGFLKSMASSCTIPKPSFLEIELRHMTASALSSIQA
jgi:hypothetical protein